MRSAFKTILIFFSLSSIVTFSAAVDCPTADKNGSPLVAPGTDAGDGFITCTYQASGACTYFGQNGEFSSGPNSRSRDYNFGSSDDHNLRSAATTFDYNDHPSSATTFDFNHPSSAASFHYVHSTTPVYYVRDYLKICSLHHFYYIEQHSNSRNNFVQRHSNLYNFVDPGDLYC
ncbi:hypothetical protein HHX47_DHR3000591 [Lentinula edodes]|nr:hypothetical protein HHX47_DHR3000591 [Lentinula edodes]